ncbi:ECF transporter S component [Thorsellia anophelis]|uniref:Energy-coupling factor transport system substrate-specific component n=1 Tax=Thorsellia anophelis DSM 18579 TaxID=1123402 RepID=A0A1H9Y630_9GAMM|nr:ECF transporter S component [Thorsellia anophelis]SES64352.1 energy-coupling factor transport system substrate-specific component [Thorsellia anophelis DSM 18579]
MNKGTLKDSKKFNLSTWSLKEIMLLVVLGSVFGVIYYLFVQLYFLLQIMLGPFADLSQHILFGSWLMVAPIAIAIIRKPFSGIFAEIMAALIEVVVLASPFGATVFISAAIQGTGSELIFAATRYRVFSMPIFILSGFFGALIPFIYSALINDWINTDLFYYRLVLQLISGVILGGVISKYTVDALRKTGVLDNFISTRPPVHDK